MHMISYEQSYDGEFMRLWTVVSELSEHVNQTRGFIASLIAHASEIKSQVFHAETGFALRKFNLDIPKDEYESEVTRMNANLLQENIALQNDNKQLSVLLKEHEQAVESIMNTFRHHAHTAQLKEMQITRYYEQLLAAKEDLYAKRRLTSETNQSETLAKVSNLLRKALRSSNGERVSEEEDGKTGEGRGYNAIAPAEDWALEREIELSRLEKENAELRLLLRLAQNEAGEDEESRHISAARYAHIPLQRHRAAPPPGYMHPLRRTLSSQGGSEHDRFIS